MGAQLCAPTQEMAYFTLDNCDVEWGAVNRAAHSIRHYKNKGVARHAGVVLEYLHVVTVTAKLE